MFFREDGKPQGKPIVLVHGFACSLHWYDRVVPRLADDYRVIRVDLNGHGRTGGDQGLNPHDQTRSLAAVLEVLDLTDAMVVGHSYGTDVALGVGAISDRVSEIVIMSQSPDYSLATLPRGHSLVGVPLVPQLVHHLTPDWVVWRVLRGGFRPGFDIGSGFDDPRQPLHDRAVMSLGMYRAVVRTRDLELRAEPLDARIRAIEKPVLAIHGRHDQFFDCEGSITRYRASGATVRVIENAGHTPNVETPDEVAALLREFLLVPRPP
ncbi:alpha/beta fold hydrolase [Nocardia rhizosphaerae]|uniref:Alpha/beta fold hydrolase n=1 Tax=Nocardia rhizosphaerae TaxID=1691571 RepID=A0ABV8LC63_9NOCA